MPVKSNTVLLTARHRCYIFSKGAVLPWRNDAKMGPANSFEYNERFDFELRHSLQRSASDII